MSSGITFTDMIKLKEYVENIADKVTEHGKCGICIQRFFALKEILYLIDQCEKHL